jgi:anti-sigma factor RsiW
MTCRDVVHLVEAIAAGELEVDDEVRGHFETCPRCAAALAAARRIELALHGWPAPEAPARFGAAVLARIRNDRWRSEQRVDRIFNVAIAASLVLVVAGVAGLTNIGAVIGIAAWIWGAFASMSGDLAQQAAPRVASYIGAAGLLMSALVMWWWADRRLSL